MSYKVSVIIPIYNIENMLTTCLDSLVNQTLKDIQIVMVDDGSTDRSRIIVDEYADKYSNFIGLHKKNGGTASARNLGLEHAEGQFIGFVDSDDWVEPDMYECMYRAAITNNADIVFTRAYGDRDSGSLEYIFPRGGFYNRIEMEENLFPFLLPSVHNGRFMSIRWANCLRIYKREIIKENEITFYAESRRCEDLAFNFECSIHANSYYYLDDKCFYHITPNPNSKTRSYTKNMTQSISSLMEYMCSVVDEYLPYDFHRQNEVSIWGFATKIVWNEMRAPNRAERYKQLKRLVNEPVFVRAFQGEPIQGLTGSNKLLVKALKTRSPIIVVGSLKIRMKLIRFGEKLHGY